MTDRYRIIARDKDGKELGHMDSGFPYQAGATLSETHPDAHTVTIERLPPEEAEPQSLWVNTYGDHSMTAHRSKERAYAGQCVRGEEPIFCVQFIEAKITESQVHRMALQLTKRGWGFGMDDLPALHAALAAALGIEE